MKYNFNGVEIDSEYGSLSLQIPSGNVIPVRPGDMVNRHVSQGDGWFYIDEAYFKYYPEIKHSDVVYYADGICDPHNMSYNGRVTIPVSGSYVYQLRDMPMVKSMFKAGDVINYPLLFLFKVDG